MSGNARFIIELHDECENEMLNVYFVIDDYKAILDVSTEIIEKIKEYSIKNVGEPSPFDWNPIENIIHYENIKINWIKETKEYINSCKLMGKGVQKNDRLE